MTTLRPANENPWYVLMTLLGPSPDAPDALVTLGKSKRIWNAWACKDLSADQREDLIRRGIALPEPGAWSAMEKEVEQLLSEEFTKRSGKTIDPKAVLEDPGWIEMEGLEISEEVLTWHYIFPRNITFAQSHFKDDTNFKDAIFLGSAAFAQCVFERGGNFENTIFDRDSHFAGSTWKSPALFRNTKCNDFVDFSNARFEDDLRAEGLQVCGQAQMTGLKVSGETRLSEATFKGELNCTRARFEGRFEADKMNVEGEALFDRAEFKGTASFNSASFKGPSNKAASFRYARFGEPTDFQAAKFSHFPDFSGTMLHDRTMFLEGDEKKEWPSPDGMEKQEDLEHAKASAAIIRHVLGKQGRPEAEHFFFRREMAFAARIGGWWKRLPYQLFGGLSDYGHSIEKPFLWLVALWFVAAVLLFDPISPGPRWVTVADAGHAAALSFANLLPALGFQKLWFDAAELANMSWRAKLICGTETMLSLPLLFLLLLGFRTRFRMR